MDNFYRYSKFEELKKKYGTNLRKKKINTAQDLDLIIRQDLEKIVYSLYELKRTSTFDILHNFFNEKNVKPISKIISRNIRTQLHHIGFEINEPMDLVVDVFEQRMQKINMRQNTKIKIIKMKRFPASTAFQKRVNAFTEIMKLWIQIYDYTLLIELFDIHHPIDFLQDNDFNTSHQMIEYLVNPSNNTVHHKNLLPDHSLFKRDPIWHYAIYIDSKKRVKQLHNYFTQLEQDTNDYKLVFSSIITNKKDAFLTKIINVSKGVEIEFICPTI